MPILEVDGEMMWQSKAIDFYLADVFKLSGNSAKEKYLIQRLVFDLEDISIKWPKFEKDEKVKVCVRLCLSMSAQFPLKTD